MSKFRKLKYISLVIFLEHFYIQQIITQCKYVTITITWPVTYKYQVTNYEKR